MSDVFRQSPPKDFAIEFMEDDGDEDDSWTKLEIIEDEDSDEDFEDNKWHQTSAFGNTGNNLDDSLDSLDSARTAVHDPCLESTQKSTNEGERLVVIFRETEEVPPDKDKTQSPLGLSGTRRRGLVPNCDSPAHGGKRGKCENTSNENVPDNNRLLKTGGQQGERIIEICLNDKDVPPKLREMVHELEASRLLRSTQQSNDLRNVSADPKECDNDDESFIAQKLFDGNSSALKFQWSLMDSFQGCREDFKPERTGSNCEYSCPYDALRMFWDDDILEHIVKETNRRASELKPLSKRFDQEWFDTNIHEILILFSFWMLHGIIRMPTIKSCFSTDPLLKASIFKSLMTEKRYWFLNKALHFVNIATRTPKSSKLFYLGPIVEHLNKKFMEAYVPGPDLTIGESLWEGQLLPRQRRRLEKNQNRVNGFELCESTTGYLWSFLFYSREDEEEEILPKNIDIVTKLIRPLLNKGYRLFATNWLISPILARYLKQNKTDCVGTLRMPCRNVPDVIRNKIPDDSCIARHSGDVVVMGYQGPRHIYTISTCHGEEKVQCDVKHRPYKPAVIADYNKYVLGADRKDLTLEPYLLERNNEYRWYITMFKKLLNVSIFNSRILVGKASGDDAQLDFRLSLINEIMKRHLAHVPQPRIRNSYNVNGKLPPSRLAGTGVHYIVHASACTPSDEKGTDSKKRKTNMRRCLWCKARENRCRRTAYLCEYCEVPLCIDGCFKKYHTEF